LYSLLTSRTDNTDDKIETILRIYIRMKISKNFRKPGFMMGFLIVGLMILLSTQCQAGPKPHKDKNVKAFEQMENDILSFQLNNTSELLGALSSFRNGNVEQAKVNRD